MSFIPVLVLTYFSLCVTMTNADLKPFVYELWDKKNSSVDVNGTYWFQGVNYQDLYLNGTQFDETFRWGPEYGSYRYPPVFPRLPNDYNMVLNGSEGQPWGRTAIYVLAKGGPTGNGPDGIKTNYAMCQLQVGLALDCSTSYNASSSGGAMGAHCGDSNDGMRYIAHASGIDAIEGNATLSAEWPNIGSEWAKSK